MLRVSLALAKILIAVPCPNKDEEETEGKTLFSVSFHSLFHVTEKQHFCTVTWAL